MAEEEADNKKQNGSTDAEETIPPRNPSAAGRKDATLPMPSDSLAEFRKGTQLAERTESDSNTDFDATLPPKRPRNLSAISSASARALDTTDDDFSSHAGKKQIFGSYLLLAEIARGGMGVVYKAEQIKLKRIVALKRIISGELATPQAVERFRIEAEAAARLDHPGIVPIFEVGERDGQHFFSMGFVEGGSLAGKLLQGPLAPHDAAVFVRKIADAVAYAHQRGVVHRDLKPANILLDRAGEPKITDFGLAKHIKNDANGGFATASGEIIGTPSYMPPEQAAGRSEQVGPISDVYSLGAILYTLMIGRPPFQASSVMETLIQVLERDPVAPRQLNSAIPKDLETICLKCLKKEIPRRYQSAEALRDELDRFLRNEPIHARPVSVSERLIRWCKRKPALASLSAAMIMLASGSFAAIFYQWQRAEHNFQQAGIQREVAETRLRQTQKIVDRYFTEVSENVLINKPGMTALRKELFGLALEYYQQFVEEEKDNTQLQAELAKAYLRLGAINDKLIRPGMDARELLQKAADILIRRLQDEPQNTVYLLDLAGAYSSMATIYAREEKYDRALELFSKALALAERGSAIDPNNVDMLNLQAQVVGNVGYLQGLRGLPTEALAKLRKSVAIREELLTRKLEPAKAEKIRAKLAISYSNLTVQLPMAEESRSAMEKAIAIQKVLHEAAPEDVEKSFQLCNYYFNMGVVLGQMKRYPEAIDFTEKANELGWKLIRDYPAIPEYRFLVVRNCAEEYQTWLAVGNKVEAARQMGIAAENADRMVELQPHVIDHYIIVGNNRRMLGDTQLEIGQTEKALANYELAFQASSQGIRTKPNAGNIQRLRITYCWRLADVWATRGDKQQSDFYFEEARRAFETYCRQDQLDVIHLQGSQELLEEYVTCLVKHSHRFEAWMVLVNGAKLLDNYSQRYKHAKFASDSALLYAHAAGFDAGEDSTLKREVESHKEQLCVSAVRILGFAIQQGFAGYADFQKLPNIQVLVARPDFRELGKRMKSAGPKE